LYDGENVHQASKIRSGGQKGEPRDMMYAGQDKLKQIHSGLITKNDWFLAERL
jgi:hypothetical protein